MQDRFKFRCYHKPTKTMEYNGLWTGYPNIERKMSDCNFEIMQCTGLSDKNGKLIYENDILKETYYSRDSKKSEECLYRVEYDEEKMAFCLVEIDSGFKTFFVDMDYVQDDYEVIGNVYTNPELLKDGE